MKYKGERSAVIISHLGLIAASVLVALPFLLLIIASLTDNAWAAANGFTFFPGKFSTDAYTYIWLQRGIIGRAYLMTIIVTLAGTAASLLITTLLAYAVSQDNIPGMRLISFFIVFTMLFNGGLVATYYSYVNLFHIRNTIFALLVPNLLVNAFNIILIRNYYKHSIPVSLTEAGRLDGAGELRIFATIVMPLSKPIIATIGLLTGIAYWNDWQNGLYFLTPRSGSHLYTIQVILNNINENVQILLQNAGAFKDLNLKMPSTTIRMAIAVAGILPVMIIYPAFQKYFVKGITLGGIKE